MQDKIIILKCPKCEKNISLKMSSFMQYLKGREYEYLRVSRKCIGCKANLELICKAAFFVKPLDDEKVDYNSNKRK